jgi:predicted RNA-binding protein Jag
MTDKVKACISVFFSQLGIEYDSLKIIEAKINVIIVKIQTQESGLFIWPNWKNLECIQGILRQMINKDCEVKLKLHLEVNDYKNSREDRLFSFVQSQINEVKKSWTTCILPFYSPYERKKIHSYVASLNDNSFYTKSRWEEKERRLHIYKKEAKLTIDIDWDDI